MKLSKSGDRKRTTDDGRQTTENNENILANLQTSNFQTPQTFQTKLSLRHCIRKRNFFSQHFASLSG